MPLTLDFAARTDLGRVRSNNEDSFIVDGETGLFVVADGMGGHSAGEVASRMACEIIRTNLRQAAGQQPDRTRVMFGTRDPGRSENADILASCVRLANRAIAEASQSSPEHRGMGTTVVCAWVREKTYYLAWVGDSRIYLVRHGAIQQLSTDHSLVQEQVAKGLITPEQAESSEFKNVLTRALGTADDVEVDTVELPVFDGDYLLLCSDGLTRMVSDETILRTVAERERPSEICDRLIALANEAGGRDNITAIVVRQRTETPWKRFFGVGAKGN